MSFLYTNARGNPLLCIPNHTKAECAYQFTTKIHTETTRMKKLTLFGLTACLLPAVCHAQSSITLYGIIDATLSYTTNQGGPHNIQLLDGGPSLSRWGLRGTEDLGGGLKAIFTLENGFNPAHGTLSQNNRLFGRQAFVGLSSDQYGSIKLGRMYDSMTNYVGQFGSAEPTIGSLTGHPGGG